jgi:hypothetical protein
MNSKSLPPVDPDQFLAMVSQWSDVINTEESGTWIWPVLNAPYRRIWQFQQDKALQQKLISVKYQPYVLVHLDLGQSETTDPTELSQTLIHSFAETLHRNFNPNDELTQVLQTLDQEYKRLIIFVTGIDTQIRQNHWQVLDSLNVIAERNWRTSVLLFTETDITHPQYANNFNKRTTLAQNISVTPLYSPEDVDAFCQHMSSNWQVQLTDEVKHWLSSQCGGHLLLVKDVIRQLRKNPHLTTTELAHLPSLIFRAQSIIANIHPDELIVIQLVSHQQRILPSLNHSLNFLLQQGWLIPETPYFRLTVTFIAEFINQPSSPPSDIFLFTETEKRVFDYGKTHLNQLIDREAIASVIWDETWEDNYSDWAIDKLISRLRTKIETAHLRFDLITKKGQGFIPSPK